MLRPRRTIFAVICGIAFVLAVPIPISFPWSTDPEVDQSNTGALSDYYRKAYSSGAESKGTNSQSEFAPLSAKEQYYIDYARTAATLNRIPERVAEFVAKYHLKDKKVLEVGAGSGLLQDLADDYTGLDISPTAQRFFHKPFVIASATEMPFQANSFDALWSVWVLEHIPNPEKALLEMRRVVKPGGYIYLLPAYEVGRYQAQGYRVRPYSDFDVSGKIVKATIPIADSRIYHYLQAHQIRLLRFFGARLVSDPSRFHYIRLTPNYEQYWDYDSDATTSFSHYELYLWFSSRGDHILDSPSEFQLIFRDHDFRALVLQVSK